MSFKNCTNDAFQRDALWKRNVGVLMDIVESGEDCVFVHPEDLPQLPERFQFGRSLQMYEEGMPGLSESLAGCSVYIDSGAGAAIACSQFAQISPAAHVMAISKRLYTGPQQLPPNVKYMVGQAQDIFPAIHRQGLKADVVTDYYGPFTFSPGKQIDLLRLYYNVLVCGGNAFVRFDADHVGVIVQSGGLKLFADWLDELNKTQVEIVDGPHPTGPTTKVRVIKISKRDVDFSLPDLKLVGTRTIAGDAVPFVLYREIASEEQGASMDVENENPLSGGEAAELMGCGIAGTPTKLVFGQG